MASPGRKQRTTTLPGVKPYPLALARLRAERKLNTVAAFANFLGWEGQLCARLESGGRALSFHEAIYIANTMGIGLEELLEDPNVIQNVPAKNSISDELQKLVRMLPSHYAAPFYAILSGLVQRDKDEPL